MGGDGGSRLGLLSRRRMGSVDAEEGWRAYIRIAIYPSLMTARHGPLVFMREPIQASPLKMESVSGAADCEFEMYFNSPSPAANDVLAHRYYFQQCRRHENPRPRHQCVLLDPTAASEDTEYRFSTYVAGALGNRLRIGGALSSVCDGWMEANTINFGAVSDDNTLLTCGPVELMRDGAFDLAKWDAIASGDGRRRRHEAMHKFAEMLAQGFDPRVPEDFARVCRETGAVLGLLTEVEWRVAGKLDMGAMHSRTFLALDNLAVTASLVVACRGAGTHERVSAAQRPCGPRKFD